ncbi:MAG: hypothetical protein QOE14_2164 [Humisphaera sp.]|nr:hypothetical protein [Humisphaera sp.]
MSSFISRAARAAVALIVCTALTAVSRAAPVLTPLVSFGGGDGWLAPSDRGYLTTDSTQRGLAFNPTTNHLLLVSRAGGSVSVRTLDAATGNDVGTLNAGLINSFPNGIFALSMIAAGDDGQIWATNLVDTATAQFRVYRWANESAVPELWYQNTPGPGGIRLGDTLDVRGVGPSAMLLGGLTSGSSGSSANNGFVMLTASGAPPMSASVTLFSTQPPFEGDFRLGITFYGNDKVLGTQGGLLNPTTRRPARLATAPFPDGSPTPPASLVASPLFTASDERPMDFATIDGTPVVATLGTDSSIVRLYDMSDPANPVLIDSLKNTSGAGNANPNGVGQVRFGQIAGNHATLYALNTNNGVQAFQVILPEPASAVAVAAMSLALLRRRRRRP